MTKKQTEFAAKEVAKLDEWARGAAFGFLAGLATPFLLYWVASGPLK